MCAWKTLGSVNLNDVLEGMTHTHIHSHTHTLTLTQKEKQTYTDRMTDRQTERQRDIQLASHGICLLPVQDKFRVYGAKAERSVFLFEKAVLIAKRKDEGSLVVKAFIMVCHS